jgi:hypothetical protein
MQFASLQHLLSTFSDANRISPGAELHHIRENSMKNRQVVQIAPQNHHHFAPLWRNSVIFRASPYRAVRV